MKNMIKLKTYAINNDCCYRTAYNRFKKGTIKGVQLDNGSILIEDETVKDSDKSQEHTKNVAIYSRVSSNDRKNQLNEQSIRLTNYAINNGFNIVKNIKEVASGMNDDRPLLNKILLDDNIDIIIVENKDRLTRFGFNYLKILLEKNNKEIIVVNKSNCDGSDTELMKDFVSLVTSFCGRIYGKRRCLSKKEKIVKILDETAD